MFVRQVVIPASPEQLWDALTEPESVSRWFGSQVEWELRPGGPARFLDDDGSVRDGVVDDVEPGRRLRFRWWPENEGPDATSEVSYDLEDDEGGTRLTVTEQRRPAPPSDGFALGATAWARTASSWTASPWTVWDSRLFNCWAQAAAPMPAPRAAR